MDTTQRIDQALRQFEFAVKLFRLIDAGRLERTALDVPVELKLGGEPFRIEGKIFREQDDFLAAAMNNVSINLGALAVALDSAYEEKNTPPDPRRLEPEQDLRSLVRMIRSAFSKDLINPRWDVRGRFVRAYRPRVAPVPDVVDLSTRDQTPFDLKDIGGAPGMDAIVRRVKETL